MKTRLLKMLAIAGVGLVLATGAVVAVAATDKDDSPEGRLRAQEAEEAQGAWLGVVVEEDEEEGDEGATAGVVVRHAAPDGPAAGAGIEEGDTITAIDGTAVDSVDDLKSALDSHSSGDEVTLTVVKADAEDGATEEISVTLADRPERPFIPGGFGDVGGMLGERFDSFLGGSFRYLDDDGNEIEVETVPGTITAISETEIRVDVNGDEGERTFSIGEDAKVPEGLEAGNRAVVMLENGELKAVNGGHFPMMPGLPGGFGEFHAPFKDALPRICEGIEDGSFPRMDRFCEKIAPEEQAEPTPQA